MTVHSNVFLHHLDLLSLQASAENGCHLCTLLHSSLDRCPDEPDPQFETDFSSNQVALVHGTNMNGECELLRVMCAGRSAELDIVTVPWTIIVTKGLSAIFVASTHTAYRPDPDKPALLGYQALQYQPGDV